MQGVLFVFLGGGIGAVLRHLVSCFTYKYFGAQYYGTLFVNIVACFIIGFFFGLVINKHINCTPQVKLFVTTGFLGGLSTLSSFANESYHFFDNGQYFIFCSYMALTIILTFIAVSLGYFLSQHS